MPLQTGHSDAVISANIKELIDAGYPPNQAAAIAYKKAGRNKDEVKKAIIDNGATNIATDILKSQEQSTTMPKTVSPNDKYVTLLNTRILSLSPMSVSAPIALGHDLYAILLQDQSADVTINHDVTKYSGAIYSATSDMVYSQIQSSPKLVFRGLSIQELVWVLYDRHIVHKQSEEQELRNDNIKDMESKIDKMSEFITKE